ncbi:hypothetical protein AB0D09_28495 [Streptomyces sp. NPDC049097]|uniref:hypothetical protein n=1 Tax=Streptomyces sp. NPDC049097 TaxID=3155497 RepID=UPI0034393EB5
MEDLLGRTHGLPPAPPARGDLGFANDCGCGAQGTNLNVMAVRHGVLTHLGEPVVLEDVEDQDRLGLAPCLSEGPGIGAVAGVSAFTDPSDAVVESMAESAVSFLPLTRKRPKEAGLQNDPNGSAGRVNGDKQAQAIGGRLGISSVVGQLCRVRQCRGQMQGDRDPVGESEVPGYTARPV